MSQTKVQKSEPPKLKLDQDFDTLVIEYHQTVRMFLARYVHCPQQVDDLAQDAFVAAYKQRNKFRNDSKISTWLLGIARNKALQYLRTEKRRLEKQTGYANSDRILRSLDALQCETNVSDAQARLELLKECLGLLPEKSARLVSHYYFDQMTAVSIAHRLKEKESAIRMKLLRIRGVLQKCITSKLQD